jgi:hypothetical protein
MSSNVETPTTSLMMSLENKELKELVKTIKIVGGNTLEKLYVKNEMHPLLQEF